MIAKATVNGKVLAREERVELEAWLDGVAAKMPDAMQEADEPTPEEMAECRRLLLERMHSRRGYRELLSWLDAQVVACMASLRVPPREFLVGGFLVVVRPVPRRLEIPAAIEASHDDDEAAELLADWMRSRDE